MKSQTLKKRQIKTIDEYIETFEPKIQKTLKEIRKFIKKEAPQASEKISFGLPSFYLNGNLLHFAAFKNHYGFFPSPSGIYAFEKELIPYRAGKGSLHFPLDQPIPWAIIKKITQFRVKENLDKAQKKKNENKTISGNASKKILKG
ncbi:MAG: DUF1801 domain-containing protein [Elusimicrobiota bacterium]|jgi:uncharacterized protein YdhG (YjbR/CyaY superfamily)|nr:DUF1801 domain-containing protein [Elusimicrobiota bacterium]